MAAAGGGWMRLVVLSAVAIAVAPAAATPTALLVVGLLGDDPLRALLMLPLMPLAWLTIPGIYGYFVAFWPVLLLGPALTLAARAMPSARSKRLWTAIGAAGGIAIVIAFVGPVPAILLAGAAAGAASALTYRLIVGSALGSPRLPEARGRSGATDY